MRIVFMFLTFVVLLGACKGSQPADTTDVLVSVKGRTLNRSEVNKLIPRGVFPPQIVCCWPRALPRNG